MIAVGRVANSHTPSGSSTVIVVEDTAVTKVKGPTTEEPIKSPTITNAVAFDAVVMTPVDELNAVALMPMLFAIAPTH
jgi:hypothetical protein